MLLKRLYRSAADTNRHKTTCPLIIATANNDWLAFVIGLIKIGDQRMAETIWQHHNQIGRSHSSQ